MSTESFTSEVMFITPEIAKEMLQKNTSNRDIRASHVVRLAEEMRSGRWALTHQGIAFNCDGTLIDGQHRLMAIVKSGVPQRMLVTRGVNKSAFLQTDVLIASRTSKDIVKIAGVDATRHHAVIAKCMAECGPDRKLASSLYSQSVLLEFIKRHQAAIDFAFHSLLKRGHAKGITQAPVSAVVARAYYTANHGRLLEFCDVLYSGMPKGPMDVGAITLRNFIMSNINRFRGSAGRNDLYHRTERALQAFLVGEQFTRATVVDRELYPIPGDRDAVMEDAVNDY